MMVYREGSGGGVKKNGRLHTRTAIHQKYVMQTTSTKTMEYTFVKVMV